MHRFFLPSHLIEEQQVTFPKEIGHQIINVLRLVEGDEVGVLDGSGEIHQVRLNTITDQFSLTGTIMATHTATGEPNVHLSLYFGLSSREKMEWILQKGTEIGVSAFHPFISSRSLVKSKMLSTAKLDRWMRIIREAAEQSGRGKLPTLVPPRALTACLAEATTSHEACLIAWEGAQVGAVSLAKAVESYGGGALALFVGPEGGFSEEEVNQGIEAGCQVVSLGARILRMETAAQVFPALVLYELKAL
jgi:16S rRNA (uracil1498-N3)-methyltransferase